MQDNYIFVVRQYENTVELYCNGYYYGYNILEYFSIDGPEFVHTVRLDDGNPLVVINELEAGRYNFACYDEEYNLGGEVEIFVTGESLEKYIDKNLPAKSKKLILDNKKLFAGETFLTDLFNFYQSNNLTNDDYKNIKEAIDAVINNHNNLNQYMNSISSDTNTQITVSKTNTLIIASNDYDYTEDCEIEIFKAELDKNYAATKEVFWKHYSLNEFGSIEFKAQLPKGLYKINILKDADLIRRYYFLADDEQDNYEKFNEILADLEHKEESRLSSMSTLPSYFESNDIREMEVLTALETTNNKRAIFERPKLTYLDGLVEADMHNIFPFIEAIPEHEFYLCGLNEEEIYQKQAKSIKIKISAAEMIFDPWEYFFKTKPYYFYVADENNVKISRTTYLDLTNVIYSDDEVINVDYNENYQKIHWQQYLKKLHTLIAEHHSDIWNTTRTTLNDYILTENYAYNDITTWLLDRVMKNWNERFASMSWIIYFANLCKYNNYTHMDRNFMKEQLFKPLYRSHIIPGGEYILAITRYYINKPAETQYITSNNRAIEFRIDEADYTVFKCIDINNNYKISDFGLYCNTAYDKIDYKFNSLEVNILKGL